MDRNELIKLAENIRNATGKTEEENDSMLLDFLANIPHPNASNLFYSIEYDDMSSEQLVDMALEYKPITL